MPTPLGHRRILCVAYCDAILALLLHRHRDWASLRSVCSKMQVGVQGMWNIIGRAVWRNLAAKTTNVVVVICFPISPWSRFHFVFLLPGLESTSRLCYKAGDAALPSNK